MTRSAAPAESFVETCRVRRSRFASLSSSAPSRNWHPMQCAHVEKIPRGHTTTPSTTERSLALHTIHFGSTALGKAAASAATTRTRSQASDRGRSRPQESGCVAGARTLQPQKVHALPTAVEHDRAEQPTGYAVERYRLPPCTDFTHRVGFIMWPCSAHPRGSGRAHRTAGGGHQGASPPGWSDAGWRRSAGSAT